MVSRILLRTLLASALLSLAHITSAHGRAHPDLATQVTQFLSGSFSSEWQALTNSAFSDVRLNTVRIWYERTDGHWLYLEQALASAPERPVRQRIYHVHYRGTVVVASIYKLPDAARFVGAWRTPWVLSGAATELLLNCDTYFARVDAHSIKARTAGKKCVSRLNGASYVTAEITLDPYKIFSLDRGFNDSDVQVWGSVEGPSEYNRIEVPN